jgi:hypothetical protein
MIIRPATVTLSPLSSAYLLGYSRPFQTNMQAMAQNVVLQPNMFPGKCLQIFLKEK